MKLGLIFNVENEQNHYQGELGKIFYARNCQCLFFKFNRCTIYAFLGFMRLTDTTFQGSPNFSKHPQRLSHNSFEPNLLLVLA